MAFGGRCGARGERRLGRDGGQAQSWKDTQATTPLEEAQTPRPIQKVLCARMLKHPILERVALRRHRLRDPTPLLQHPSSAECAPPGAPSQKLNGLCFVSDNTPRAFADHFRGNIGWLFSGVPPSSRRSLQRMALLLGACLLLLRCCRFRAAAFSVRRGGHLRRVQGFAAPQRRLTD